MLKNNKGYNSTELMKLRENCLYLELFWSVFSRIRTEYGDILCILEKCGPG